GRDVAGAAGEIHLECLRLLVLPFLAGQTAEIGTDPAVAVIAHRVRGIVAQGGQRLVVVPETQRLQPRIDQAFRGVARPRIGRGPVADETNLAIVAENTPVGGHLLDAGLAYSNVGECRSLPE